MKTLFFITNSLMGLVLSRFAISKLAGWEISVKAFIEMAQPLGIDPTFFRIFTGFIILGITIGYITTALLTIILNNVNPTLKKSFSKFAILSNLLGIGTMTGALISEFVLREEPKWLLVYIAIGVIIFSTINLYLLVNKSIFKSIK